MHNIHGLKSRGSLLLLSMTRECHEESICYVHAIDKRISRENSSSVDNLTRRRSCRVLFQSILMGAFPWRSFHKNAYANDVASVILPRENNTVFLSGRINLPSGMTDPGGLVDDNNESADKSTMNYNPRINSALYVTARPNRPDNVPKAILDGSRGKSPPVLTARFESPTFPFDFNLSENNLTPEGSAKNDDTFWWAADDLIVSARWDSDGVAATRSPDDLVGRTLWKRGSAKFVLDLQGRGSFGKFATRKN